VCASLQCRTLLCACLTLALWLCVCRNTRRGPRRGCRKKLHLKREVATRRRARGCDCCCVGVGQAGKYPCQVCTTYSWPCLPASWPVEHARVREFGASGSARCNRLQRARAGGPGAPPPTLRGSKEPALRSDRLMSTTDCTTGPRHVVGGPPCRLCTRLASPQAHAKAGRPSSAAPRSSLCSSSRLRAKNAKRAVPPTPSDVLAEARTVHPNR